MFVFCSDSLFGSRDRKALGAGKSEKKFMKKLLLVAVVYAFSLTLSAQDLKSVLTGVVKSALGDKITTAETIIGTWNYSAPECRFESENFLAQAGSETISSRIESKMEPIYQKLGLENSVFVFNEDGTYSLTLKKKTSNGTYVFDKEEKTLTMTNKLGLSMKANVIVTGKTMYLLFKADKLMAALKILTSVTSKESSAIASLAGNYDGLLLGFELKK